MAEARDGEGGGVVGDPGPGLKVGAYYWVKDRISRGGIEIARLGAWGWRDESRVWWLCGTEIQCDFFEYVVIAEAVPPPGHPGPGLKA